MSEPVPREIRGVMIPITGARLLLPNATIAEVISYSTPEKIAGAPDWLLGRLQWRGWRLPLFSFTVLSGVPAVERVTNAKVAVLKTLGGNAQIPFIALLAQGFPRLTTIEPDLLIPASHDGEHTTAVRAQVLVRNDQAIIPDLSLIESMLIQAQAA